MDLLRHTVLLRFVLALLCSGISASAAQEVSRDQSPAALPTASVIHDLCDKTVVLLGEPPVHAFGKVLDFKVELVRRLIGECHFNGFFIESGAYDFLEIQKLLNSGKEVTKPMIAAAIGGIWANQETERLIPDLLEAAQSGTLRLGGLDDQLSRGTWAQRDMPGELVHFLEGSARDECLSILQRHTLWQYNTDSPYGPKDNARIAGCLDKIEAAASKSHTEDAACDLAMVTNFKRSLARDFPAPGAKDTDVQGANERDRSMYQNFQWLRSRMPSRSKIIVWTATTHAAKDLSVVPGDERISMGSFLHHDLGGRAFALGFSEYSGSYAFGRQAARQLAAAPDDSLESRAFAGNGLSIRYFGWNDLRNFGPIAARPLGIDFKTARWDGILDGLVAFRAEHPPTVPARPGGK